MFIDDALSFVADLPEGMYEELEHTLFFNARQRDVRTGIVDAIERYGVPEIVRDAGKIRVTMPGCPHSQCLFAIVDTPECCELLGLALYVRDAHDAITVLHVAVSDDIVADDGQNPLVAVRLVQKIREVGQCLRGVRWVRLLYPSHGQQRLPVARGSRVLEPSHVRKPQVTLQTGSAISGGPDPSLNTQSRMLESPPSGTAGQQRVAG